MDRELSAVDRCLPANAWGSVWIRIMSVLIYVG
jgi:hypothetical protein